MDFVIRDAVVTDCDAICSFWSPMIRDTAVSFAVKSKTPSEVANLIVARRESGHGVLVAEVGGAVHGFATYGQFRPGEGYATCMEHTIILAPEAQGRGIGREMLRVIEAHAKAGGAHQLIAGISGENGAGQRFHAACGYQEIARIARAGCKFGRYMDLILMQKFLT